MNESLFDVDNLSLNATDGARVDPPSSTDSPLVTINGNTFSTACIAYLQTILPPDALGSAIVHCSTSSENNALDSWGLQGGQGWTAPTTKSPTTSSPTSIPSFAPSITAGEPTYHPTLHDKLFVLRGTIYYDRNANGARDANVETEEYGSDTEYNIGLGGVNLRLVECDISTNQAVKNQVNALGEEEEGWNSYSSTISQGYDILFRPMLADQGADGGK